MTAPVGFVQFVETVLMVTLWHAQRILGLVAFDGVDPCDLEGDDRELARLLFGDVGRIPPEARAVLAAVCGRGSGKSYELGGLYLLWRALTAILSSLAPGEQAFGIVVDPDMRLARQTLRFASGAARTCPSIAPLIEIDTPDALGIRRPDGQLVVIECLPATRGGSALRGRSVVGAVLDECAFFRDENYAVNDAEIFKAVAPRVLPGGMVVLASTPWAESGLLFDEFQRNFGHPVTALACHAPTALLRPDPVVLAMVQRERERDPENARREFDAEFMGSGSGLFFSADACVVCQDVGPLTSAPLGVVVGVGGDLALVRDAAALVVVHHVDGFFDVAEVVELRPSKGNPLKLSGVVREFCEVTQRHGARTILVDHHVLEPAREHLPSGCWLDACPGGQQGKIDTYTQARNLLHSGLVRIPPEYRRLANQLREVVSRPSSGGGLSITSPRRGGAHGDLVSALVLALHAVSSAPRPMTADELKQFEEANADLGGFSRWDSFPFDHGFG